MVQARQSTLDLLRLMTQWFVIHDKLFSAIWFVSWVQVCTLQFATFYSVIDTTLIVFHLTTACPSIYLDRCGELSCVITVATEDTSTTQDFPTIVITTPVKQALIRLTCQALLANVSFFSLLSLCLCEYIGGSRIFARSPGLCPTYS
ncbi:uncharacterized protein YALI1_B23443g [Yarrowia lipolytica]|uniref:Uncharacterized protein n=1 Tax=Yarrowia lipolytica TaxID=4952 RepID=A0A1D8N8A3_YARLL|nr:hypothetical protein YALI1_B23443g [Yarrowia lipolytica]